jgi:hypothetical protein
MRFGQLSLDRAPPLRGQHQEQRNGHIPSDDPDVRGSLRHFIHHRLRFRLVVRSYMEIGQRGGDQPTDPCGNSCPGPFFS